MNVDAKAWMLVAWDLTQRMEAAKVLLKKGAGIEVILRALEPGRHQVVRRGGETIQMTVENHVAAVVGDSVSKTEAARRLGVNRSTLYNYMTGRRKIQLMAGVDKA